jgi:hypothetical protein
MVPCCICEWSIGICDVPAFPDCEAICEPPGVMGMLMPGMLSMLVPEGISMPVIDGVPRCLAGLFPVGFPATDFFAVAGFLAAALLAGAFLFAAGFFFAAGLTGIAMCMPGMFICAAAGAGRPASAIALAPTNKIFFTECLR